MQFAFGLLTVGFLWGCTNPFLRMASIKSVKESASDRNPESCQSASKESEFSKNRLNKQTDCDTSTTGSLPSNSESNRLFSLSFGQLLSLVLTNASFYIPFLINQSGSFVYYYLLGSYDVTIAVPAANGLALAFTAITEAVLRKLRINNQCSSIDNGSGFELKDLIGILMIMTGFTICQMNANVAKNDN